MCDLIIIKGGTFSFGEQIEVCLEKDENAVSRLSQHHTLVHSLLLRQKA